MSDGGVAALRSASKLRADFPGEGDCASTLLTRTESPISTEATNGLDSQS